MSEIPQGWGWWQASDGKWYPPESHPSVRGPQPPALPPLSSPVGYRSTGPNPQPGWRPEYPTKTPSREWSAPPPATPNHEAFVAVSTRRPKFSRRPQLLLALLLMLVVAGGTAAFLLTNNSNPQASATGQTTTTTTPTTAPVTTTLPPESAANAIGLQAGDLGSGFVEEGPAASPLTQPTAPSPCTPVSSQPWLAFVDSPEYTSGPVGPVVYSTIVIMPTAADAQNALAAVSFSSYGAICYRPTFDLAMQQGITATNQETGCDEQFAQSTIAAIPAGSITGSASGWHYDATILCNETGTTGHFYIDIVSQVVGRVFVQATFRSEGTAVSFLLERSVMDAMVTRAHVQVPN